MRNFDSLFKKDVQVIIEYLESEADHKKPGDACP
jgi:hypothetical protein